MAALDAIGSHYPTVTALTLEDDEIGSVVSAIEQDPVSNIDNPDYPLAEADINAPNRTELRATSNPAPAASGRAI